MPDQRPESKPKPDLPIGTRVKTLDGIGEIVSYNFRKNTNAGPGTKQYVVRLSDGRIHRYSKNAIQSVSL